MYPFDNTDTNGMPSDMVQGILSARFQQPNPVPNYAPVASPGQPQASQSPMDMLQAIGQFAQPNWQDRGMAASARLATNNPAISDESMTAGRLAPQLGILKALSEAQLQGAQSQFYNQGGLYGMRPQQMFDTTTNTVRAVSPQEAMNNRNLLSVDDPQVKQRIAAAQERGKMGLTPPSQQSGQTNIGGQIQPTDQNSPQSGAGGQPGRFGFDLSSMTPEAYKAAVETDKKRQQAYEGNKPLMYNMANDLDSIEANANQVKTGAGAGLIAGPAEVLNTIAPDTFTGGANYNTLNKSAMDFVTNAQAFQHVPGTSNRTELAMKTLLDSKPGIGQQRDTNMDVIAQNRAKLAGYATFNDLANAYRQASPLHITDSNFDQLDDALKTIFPLESVDPKTGRTMFNAQNVQAIRDAIPDAIANPQKYLQMARKGPGSAPQAPGNAAPQATAVPQGVDPNLWQHMTPQEQALFK